jgi:hypothetical protein
MVWPSPFTSGNTLLERRRYGTCGARYHYHRYRIAIRDSTERALERSSRSGTLFAVTWVILVQAAA